ncbi:hypothetical protein HPG69_014712 [Diceros bicornis minor]|uniref:60S ribosomal protein L17 n=1 Tax=Diceros bicornis minor TaxID=77932 RepID=A0A7J7EXY8_DICBM|nr:hypothetical protein HPG69_014712 [Diceros bicornis minor]
MVHCLLNLETPTKSCKSRGSNLRVHFTDTCETAQAVKDMHPCVPLHGYNGGAGRYAQDQQWGWTQGRGPKKSAEFLLHILRNADSNAALKDFDVDSLVTELIQINPCMSSSCLTETTLPEKGQIVPKLKEEVAQKKKISQKKLKKQKLMA